MAHNNYSSLDMTEQAPSVSGSGEHELFQPLRTTIHIAMSQGKSGEQIADEILRLLDRKRIVSYSRPDQIQLLNSHGRVLIAILEDPGITQRALSQYLSVSESNINASVKLLLKNGLINKAKIKNRNAYSFNYENGLLHPDISRFLDTLLPYVKQLADRDNANRT